MNTTHYDFSSRARVPTMSSNFRSSVLKALERMTYGNHDRDPTDCLYP